MRTDNRARIDAQIAASNRQRRIEMCWRATTLLSGLSHCAGVILAPKINARLKAHRIRQISGRDGRW